VSFNWNELLEDPEGIESSALERVVGIGQGRVVRGVSVELHSLEIRELGSFGLIRTDIGAERTPPEHLLTGLIAPEIAVDDGIGTHYSCFVVASEGGTQGPGSAIRFRHRFSIVPAFPSGATLVRLRIARFRAERMVNSYTPEAVVHGTEEAEPLVGPWEFSRSPYPTSARRSRH
jgi:hypothetical protein